MWESEPEYNHLLISINSSTDLALVDWDCDVIVWWWDVLWEFSSVSFLPVNMPQVLKLKNKKTRWLRCQFECLTYGKRSKPVYYILNFVCAIIYIFFLPLYTFQKKRAHDIYEPGRVPKKPWCKAEVAAVMHFGDHICDGKLATKKWKQSLKAGRKLCVSKKNSTKYTWLCYKQRSRC